ncbi:hypothetical protein [Peribacillus simplex]|uniref:hypothetical protein n=1 Tax=Peribacillus simplex TaxID=1478 RepID=UPI003D0773AE
MVFKGEEGFPLEQITFKTPPRIPFHDYAGTTLNALKAMHKAAPEFRNLIKGTFKEARG